MDMSPNSRISTKKYRAPDPPRARVKSLLKCENSSLKHTPTPSPNNKKGNDQIALQRHNVLPIEASSNRTQKGKTEKEKVAQNPQSNNNKAFLKPSAAADGRIQPVGTGRDALMEAIRRVGGIEGFAVRSLRGSPAGEQD
jgi:hypothetical protein